MCIELLNIENVRIIQSQSIEFCPGLNVFYGNNGSGKTSVIEAIHILGTGKSFRSNQVKRVIRDGESELTVFAQVKDEQSDLTHKIGIRRSLNDTHARIDGSSVKGFSELAKCMPLLLITPESHRLLESGPSWRRKYLDWGVFHVEHEYAASWSKYNQALKQRNSLLQNGRQQDIDLWTDTLVELGQRLHQFRRGYFENLRPLLEQFSETFLPGQELDFSYYAGWNKEKALADVIKEHLAQDRIHGRTEYGPHRADIRIRFNGMNAKDSVSRGQQKLLVYAMQMAQTSCVYEVARKRSTLLLDDLGAELDSTKINILMDVINREFNQAIITTADQKSIPLDIFESRKLFHVEHGVTTPV